ncbi:NmrA family transcriptional regulator [Nocardia sp. NBC_01503]|uniref:NmrA family NAD(P)-binding protein n=1 Tax=Nocardia sp. NBC_01503 TaxID=2975997 RepID=UPI002E7C0C72|nr:NAD(P)H-binding protein [Nocardia sp. NBC_01503]WTL33674.1 NmrA family transcriptional regulator [Nocardia sp. NBC_01503]
MTNKETVNSENTILVIGGTGKTGSRVAARLTALGVPVRIGSRTATIPFDWTDRETWGPALAGVGAVYLSYQPDLAVPGAAADIKSLTALAAAAGVRRIVLLSGRGEVEALECEGIVRNSGIPWTVVRCAFFAQNFSEGSFADYILAGEVALPSGDVPEPFVDADDIADVAVAALTEDGHGGEIYELTGPRALTFAEATAEIARATGREIAFIPLSRTDFVASLTSYGVPADEVSLLDYLFGTILDGRNSQLTDGVFRALGRRPRDFAEYARDVASSGAWSATAHA